MPSRTRAPRQRRKLRTSATAASNCSLSTGFLGVFVDCCKDLKIGVLKFLLKPTLGFLGGLLQ